MRRRQELTWLGSAVATTTPRFEELPKLLPRFEQRTFGEGDAANKYHDMIVRLPTKDAPAVPVAIVSKRYALVQHTDVVNVLAKSLQGAGFKPTALPVRLRMTEYGERMHLSLRLPDHDFDPGDGKPLVLRVNCFNSVDKSLALEVGLTWERLVCKNGMTVGVKEDGVRQFHVLESLDSDEVAEFLRHGLEKVPDDKRTLQVWMTKPVDLPKVEAWADETLMKRWGCLAAARTCHIARTGFDGGFYPLAQKGLPHNRRIKSRERVPGCRAPITNVYELGQALSWIARERQTVQEQLAMMMEIPGLIEPLLN